MKPCYGEFTKKYFSTLDSPIEIEVITITMNFQYFILLSFSFSGLVLMIERGLISSVSNLQRTAALTNSLNTVQTNSQIQTEMFDQIWMQQA